MISPVTTTAVSGLQAASRRLETASRNLVNQESTAAIDSQGQLVNQPYQPVDTVQISGAYGVVNTVDRLRDPASVPVYNPADPAANDNGVVNYPNVDTAQELVNINIATYDYKANLSVLKQESKRLGDLLDIFS